MQQRNDDDQIHYFVIYKEVRDTILLIKSPWFNFPLLYKKSECVKRNITILISLSTHPQTTSAAAMKR